MGVGGDHGRILPRVRAHPLAIALPAAAVLSSVLLTGAVIVLAEAARKTLGLHRPGRLLDPAYAAALSVVAIALPSAALLAIGPLALGPRRGIGFWFAAAALTLQTLLLTLYTAIGAVLVLDLTGSSDRAVQFAVAAGVSTLLALLVGAEAGGVHPREAAVARLAQRAGMLGVGLLALCAPLFLVLLTLAARDAHGLLSYSRRDFALAITLAGLMVWAAAALTLTMAWTGAIAGLLGLRHDAARTGRCPQCGYGLDGLTRNRCPECGAFLLEEHQAAESASGSNGSHATS
ncbi:MAG: hypothetical protein ACTS22_02620 [Phycisphaerales bacterium]